VSSSKSSSSRRIYKKTSQFSKTSFGKENNEEMNDASSNEEIEQSFNT
jgi:hypothetical protein